MNKTYAALLLSLLLGAVALVSQVFAQDGGGEGEEASETLALGGSEGWGTHLVTGDGMSVYLYVLDQEGPIACVDACTDNWPPLLVEEGVEPTVSSELDPALVGTVERPDGGIQVTYGGHPLYTFRRDVEPGHARGQALGDQFFLVSAAGAAVTEREEEEEVVVDEATLASLMEDGRQVYASNCAVCHGPEGQGGIGPGFAGNSVLGGKSFVINRIIDGFPDHGMPPFGHLSDRQIASVATYIRNSWENEFSPVLEEEVAAQR